METTMVGQTTVAPAAPHAAPGAPSLAALHVARRCLLAAALLGVAGDVLLRRGIWGVGFPLFVTALLGALAWLMRAGRRPWTLGACLLVVPTIFFAASFAWRDSSALAFYNMLALLAALAALAGALLRGEEWEPASSVGAYARGAGRVAIDVAGGSGLLLLGGRVRELPTPGRLRHAGAVARGAVLALPLLFVFGSLLSAADPVFARLVRETLDVDLGALVSHAVVMLCVAWIAGGYLHSALLERAGASAAAPPPRLSLGVVEVGLVLSLLDLLFLSFVLVQLRYLFGGAGHVAATAGMTYAEYARRGFFELVWVAALALPTLLAADGLLRRREARDDRIFRALAGLLLVLLGVVMLSAMQRMRLYQREYGLTETRLYASAAMGWLAVTFAWFAATVLRGRRAPFAFGALLSAWAVVGVLDIASPDALIARTNLARMRRGERFDPYYTSHLSADATPVLVRALPELTPQLRCPFAQQLVQQPDVERDWRVWNAGRARARRAVATHVPELRAALGGCPAASASGSPAHEGP